MKTVYTTSNLADAEIVRVRLRNGGIRSTLDGVNGGIRGPATPLSVSVSDRDEPKARKLVANTFRRQRRPSRASSRRAPKRARPSP